MLICSAEIIHVGDASGAGANLGASWRVVRGERSEIDVEDGGDDGLAVKLQKNFAGVSVLRKQPGLADVRKIIIFLVGVIFENGFGLRQRNAGKKRDADPVMDDAAGHVAVMVVVQGMHLFEIVFAAAELRVDFVAARIGEAVHIKEVAGEKIGVHAGFGFFAVMVEGGECFGLGLVGASERSKKANGGSEQGCEEGSGDGWLHETSVLKTFSMPGFASTNPETPSPRLDEERKREVRVKDVAGSVLEQRVCKSGVVESFGRDGGLQRVFFVCGNQSTYGFKSDFVDSFKRRATRACAGASGLLQEYASD